MEFLISVFQVLVRLYYIVLQLFQKLTSPAPVNNAIGRGSSVRICLRRLGLQRKLIALVVGVDLHTVFSTWARLC